MSKEQAALAFVLVLIGLFYTMDQIFLAPHEKD